MAWVKLDDAYTDHPKFVALSDGAFRLWHTALAYCNRWMTDGYVPDHVVPSLTRETRHQKLVDELMRLRLWEQADGGFRFHDYEHYQPSRAKLLEQRATKARNGQLGGIASGESRRTKPEAEAKQTGSTDEAKSKHGAEQNRSTGEPNANETRSENEPRTPYPVPGSIDPVPPRARASDDDPSPTPEGAARSSSLGYVPAPGSKRPRQSPIPKAGDDACTRQGCGHSRVLSHRGPRDVAVVAGTAVEGECVATDCVCPAPVVSAVSSAAHTEGTAVGTTGEAEPEIPDADEQEGAA